MTDETDRLRCRGRDCRLRVLREGVRRIRCALTKTQSPLRFEKARVYLTRHQLIEHSVPARMHLHGKFSQIRGFVVRAKTKSRDQVRRNCCDLISAGIKEWQSHREASICRPQHLTESAASQELFKPTGPLPLRQAWIEPAPVVATALFEASSASDFELWRTRFRFARLERGGSPNLLGTILSITRMVRANESGLERDIRDLVEAASMACVDLPPGEGGDDLGRPILRGCPPPTID
jgi:hypothetical protein